ncbi:MULTISPECIES: papain-like cysteine protease family protein [Mycobacterium]|uniref:papain-like cysteine protease family protein n=1 Tax=Mycobacterium TaxID=1763 RepID=UPI00205F454E|nr:hypothetical protein IWGMT90018_26910 [Mycobacterium kiyosense]BDE14483.1 hypothetical protein MKCMC460_33430 [Mycobacterium sp. 20KCMC460]GLB91167.1 hypothetical protein SRL2020130_39840 [Mycobacterium kiyosense]GLC02184.1 hypothetical protein SRL2020400_27750 [Mycobacterium kiyosense]GLC09610.1 hypothetical protein SRL2020411_42560 [Mycobacterium kiyosense]
MHGLKTTVPRSSAEPGIYQSSSRSLRTRVPSRAISWGYQGLAGSVRAGYVAPIYIGSEGYPQHIMVVTGVQGDSLRIYDPSSGRMTTVPQQQFSNRIFSRDEARPPESRPNGSSTRTPQSAIR